MKVRCISLQIREEPVDSDFVLSLLLLQLQLSSKIYHSFKRPLIQYVRFSKIKMHFQFLAAAFAALAVVEGAAIIEYGGKAPPYYKGKAPPYYGGKATPVCPADTTALCCQLDVLGVVDATCERHQCDTRKCDLC